MCAFVKRSFMSHIGLGRLGLSAGLLVAAVNHGLPQQLSAAEPPSYRWETVLPDGEFLDLDIPYGIRVNSYGDAVGRGRKLVSVDFSPDLEQWNEGEDVQVVAFRYPNSPSVLDTWGYVETVADWGTLVDRAEWPVPQLADGTWMRYPIIKAAEPGRAWKITSIRDINAHGEMVGHARSYSYCADDERYVRASSTMIWLTVDPVVGASDKKRIGWSSLNETTAFRYSDGVGMVDLVNSTETTRGWARDINSNGDTIGNVTRDGVELPFVYTDETGFLDLEPLIENLPEVLGRLGAQRITDNGEFLLSHDQLPDGRTELVILRPITDGEDPSPDPEPEPEPEPDFAPFFSTDTPMTIADAHPRQGARDTVSTISISATGTEVDSLLLLVDITHDAPGQLSGELVDPDGNGFELFGQGDLEEDVEFEVYFDVSRSLDGAWKLILRDHVRGVTGTLNGWAIIGLVD